MESSSLFITLLLWQEPYVENTLHSTNKYSCVRRVHTLYISYFREHNGDDEPHDLRMRAMNISFCTFLHLCAISSPTCTKASFVILFSNTLSSYLISLTLKRKFSILTPLNNNHNSSAADCFLFQVSNN